MKEIKLVDIIEADASLQETVRQWRNKPEIRKHMLSQHLITEKEHMGWIRSLRYSKNSKFWIVFVGSTPIGSAYFQNMDFTSLTSEWGFYIAEKEYKGKGFGKVILSTLLNKSFNEMEFKTLNTKVLSSNLIALSLYKKFNFIEKSRVPYDDLNEIVSLELSINDWKNSYE